MVFKLLFSFSVLLKRLIFAIESETITFQYNLCQNEILYLDQDQKLYQVYNRNDKGIQQQFTIQQTNGFQLQTQQQLYGRIIAIYPYQKISLIKFIEYKDHYLLAFENLEYIINQKNCQYFVKLTETFYLILCYENCLVFLTNPHQINVFEETQNDLKLSGNLQFFFSQDYDLILGFDLLTPNWKIYHLKFDMKTMQIGLINIFDKLTTKIEIVKKMKINYNQRIIYIMTEQYIHSLDLSLHSDTTKLKQVKLENNITIIDFQIYTNEQGNDDFYFKYVLNDSYFIRYDQTYNEYITSETEFFVIYQNYIVLKNENRIFFENQNTKQLVFDKIQFFQINGNQMIIQDSNQLYLYKLLRTLNYVNYSNQENHLVIKEIPKKNQNQISLLSIQFDNCDDSHLQQFDSKFLLNDFNKYEDCLEKSEFKMLLYMNETITIWLKQDNFAIFIVSCQDKILVQMKILEVLEYKISEKLICEQKLPLYTISYLVTKSQIKIIQISHIGQIFLYNRKYQQLKEMYKKSEICHLKIMSNVELYLRNTAFVVINHDGDIETYELWLNFTLDLYFRYNYESQYLSQNYPNYTKTTIKNRGILFLNPNYIIFIIDESTIEIYRLVLDGQLLFCYILKLQDKHFTSSLDYKFINYILAIKVYDFSEKPYLIVIDISKGQQEAIQFIIPLYHYGFQICSDSIVLFDQLVTYKIAFEQLLSFQISESNFQMIFYFGLISLFQIILQIIINYYRGVKHQLLNIQNQNFINL